MQPAPIAMIVALALAVHTHLVLAQPAVPDAIAAPGETAVLTVHAIGVQVYDCKPDVSGALAWQFREPVATLIVDGKTLGRHFTGPTWELADGSAVVGKATGRAPGAGANDIPWLKLQAAGSRGTGRLSGVTTIQRINTAGGNATGTCERSGTFLGVPYAADYVFLKPGG